MDSPQLRPFYHEFAWAYAYIIDAPLVERCNFIERMIRNHQRHNHPRVLDAGCGPGHYSAALAQRGFQVVGLDSSQTFVQLAQSTYGIEGPTLQFLVGNILDLRALPPFDAIVCRGVLNDVLEPSERAQAFQEFSRALSAEGVLLFDMRDWEQTVERISHNPEFRKSVMTDRGQLTFRSITTLHHAEQQMHVHECHHLYGPEGESEHTYEFVMRCWTRDEVRERLEDAQFHIVQQWGGYDEQVLLGMTDRIVTCARR